MIATTVAALLLQTASIPAVKLNCADFVQRPDGSWQTARQVILPGATGGRLILMRGAPIQAEPMGGLPLSTLLKAQCAAPAAARR